MTKEILTAVAAATITAAAQTTEPVEPFRQPMPLPPPQPIIIKVPEQENLLPVQVVSADVKAEVNGCLSETTMELVFHNPNGRILEGELLFPLPAEATISGYALDINGKMIDGVIVEKEKARVAFETEVRQGVDPGLVEQTIGNTFRTRIYPLPANGRRTIRIRYVSQIQTVKEDGGLASYYVQPLRFPGKLEKFHLRLEVAAAQKPPKVVGGSLANLNFQNWRSAYIAETTLEDIELTEDLYVAIMTRPEENLVSQPCGDKYYFAAQKILDTEKLLGAAGSGKQTPVVLWDASYSRNASDHDKELEFLQAYLKDAKNIRLQVFRNAAAPAVTCADAKELVAKIKQQPYDGATCLQAAFAALTENSEVLLFSDGLDTFSPPSPTFALPANCRLSAFFTDKDQNQPFLRGLARKSGGVCLDLRTTPLAEALRLQAKPQIAVSKVVADGADLTSDVNWQLDGSRLVLSGVAGKSVAKLQVTLLCGDQSQELTLAGTEENNLEPGNLLRTFYGQTLIASKIGDGADDKELTSLGKEYQLVTPTTSLLVLDNLSQYLKYGIRPPETLPELRKAYDEQHRDTKDDIFALRPKSEEQVINLWNSLVAWHKTDFPRKTPRDFPKDDSEPGILTRAAAAVAAPVMRAFGAGSDNRREAMAASAHHVVLREVEDGAVDGLVTHRERLAAPGEVESNGTASLPPAPVATTTLKAWNPDAPYLSAMKSKPQQAYAVYLQQRELHGSEPGFYLDCADYFASQKDKALAIQVASNLAELELENKPMLRALGYKLRFLGDLTSAESIFRRVVPLAQEEPQSYRDLALVLDDQEKFQEAVDTMMTLVKYQFDHRFPEIEVIALTEINRMIARAKRKGIEIKGVDKKFIHLIDTDIRIVLNWDADMMDIDLWTIDPEKVKCYYGYRKTGTGGRNSCDFTQGYGPEEFMIRDALKGKYKILAHYFASHSQKALGPVTLYVEVFTNFGRVDEKKEVLTCRLANNKEEIEIGAIEHSGINRPPHHDAPFSYQIKKGDTLESIAKTQLGDASRVKDILALNPNLPATGKLPVGVIIKLPATE